LAHLKCNTNGSLHLKEQKEKQNDEEFSTTEPPPSTVSQGLGDGFTGVTASRRSRAFWAPIQKGELFVCIFRK